MTTYVLSTETARDGCARLIGRLPVDPVHQVVVKPFEETRRDAQNRRLWVLLGLVAQYMPDPDGVLHGKEYWHHFFRIEFDYVTGETITLANGFEMPIAKSSAQMKVKEFGEYMEKVELRAAEHGILMDNWQT